jgi:hypothetical protein
VGRLVGRALGVPEGKVELGEGLRGMLEEAFGEG